MIQERNGALTFKGAPITLLGPELKPGDKAPAFISHKGLNAPIESKELEGKLRFFNVVPSLDTGICDAQTKRFSEEAAKFPAVEWITVSCDTPMAQSRWCGAASVSKIRMISDYRDHAFGLAYGVYVKELGLLQRAIFIVGADDRIHYVQRVPEIAQHPDYDEALMALRQALG